jgi:hypothetical protein
MKKFSALLVALVACVAVVGGPGARAANKKTNTLKVKSGTAKTTFTPEFIKALVDAGVTPGPVAPGTIAGTADGIVTLTLPVTGGTVKQKGKTATIQANKAAGQILTKNSDQSTRTITNIVTKIKGSKTTVVADAGGTILGVPGVTFLRGTGATFKLTKKGFTSSGDLVLSDEAAADLATNFGITTLPAGTKIGSGTITVKGTSK